MHGKLWKTQRKNVTFLSVFTNVNNSRPRSIDHTTTETGAQESAHKRTKDTHRKRTNHTTASASQTLQTHTVQKPMRRLRNLQDHLPQRSHHRQQTAKTTRTKNPTPHPRHKPAKMHLLRHVRTHMPIRRATSPRQ